MQWWLIVVVLIWCSACAQPQSSSDRAVDQTPTPQPTAPTDIWAPAPVTKSSGCVAQNGRPDRACTPGALDARVTQDTMNATICTRNYTSTVRPASRVTDAIKRERMKAYGLEGERLADYELDHLVSLAIGGAPADVANLWPQVRVGEVSAKQKDAVEDFLHREVCRGSIALRDAQRMMADDWVAVYIGHSLTPSP